MQIESRELLSAVSHINLFKCRYFSHYMDQALTLQVFELPRLIKLIHILYIYFVECVALIYIRGD